MWRRTRFGGALAAGKAAVIEGLSAWRFTGSLGQLVKRLNGD
ncbi:hypothetical protein [Paraburkholderia megapolitana]|nr:hypothetical protein [Paraburkholderia megapolitana]